MHCHRSMFIKNTKWSPVCASHCAPVGLYDTAHRCVSTTYGHRTNTSTNYKSRCVCAILHTDVFTWDYSLVRLYDLWAPQKYQYELEQSVHLCDTMHQCVYVRLLTSAFIRPMGTTQIPIQIRKISAFVWCCALMRFYNTTNRCIDMTYGHRTKPNTN